MNATSPSLRDAHKALTRQRILDAALELLRSEDLDSLTIASIAAEAGITERTVYRHFATREEMLAAVWPHMQARVRSRGFPGTGAELVAQPLYIFPNFQEQEGAIRASVFSKAGRELRMSVNAERQAAFLRCVRDARPDLEEPELTRLAAVVQLLDSAYAWALIKDHWGLGAGEAARASSDAIAKLLDLPRADAPEDQQPSATTTKEGKSQ